MGNGFEGPITASNLRQGFEGPVTAGDIDRLRSSLNKNNEIKTGLIDPAMGSIVKLFGFGEISSEESKAIMWERNEIELANLLFVRKCLGVHGGLEKAEIRKQYQESATLVSNSIFRPLFGVKEALLEVAEGVTAPNEEPLQIPEEIAEALNRRHRALNKKLGLSSVHLTYIAEPDDLISETYIKKEITNKEPKTDVKVHAKK